MIKIIEPGTRTVTICKYCGCKFSYEKEDIKLENGPSMEVELRPVRYKLEYVVCPQCGKKLYITKVR